VLLAMLLDVPLTDQHIVLPETLDPAALDAAKLVALIDIATSNRRGYRTFDPLPVHIEQEELFFLAAQALKDVADIELVGDILESIAGELEDVHDRARWRLRPWEQSFYQEIDVVLFARGRGRRLELTAKKMKGDVDFAKRWVDRGESDRRAEGMRQLSVSLSDYAGVLHQLGRYDEAARCYVEVVQIGRELTGKDPAITGYNRACALAKGGRKDEAILQLARALDRGLSAGSEDLTQEWVTEDGDLRSLHDDPRFTALIKRHFGE
jgi:tetratricopeptide (TPR) repeat protein